MRLNWKKILQYLAMILATLAGGYGGGLTTGRLA